MDPDVRWRGHRSHPSTSRVEDLPIGRFVGFRDALGQVSKALSLPVILIAMNSGSVSDRSRPAVTFSVGRGARGSLPPRKRDVQEDGHALASLPLGAPVVRWSAPRTSARARVFDVQTMRIDVSGEGPPLVLVGGGLTGWQSWIPHQERLAPTRRVARAQPLNVQLGLDDVPLPPAYSVELESESLGAALEREELDGTLDLVAWSYGAVVALDYALGRPERIRTLTLIEPPAFWVLEATGTWDERSSRERDELRSLHDGMRDDVSEDQLEEFLRLAGLSPPGTSVRSMPSWPSWVTHRRSLRQGPALFAHRDEASRLRGFGRPVLLFKGTGSSYVFHRIVDVLDRTFPDARLVELPGGHAPQLVAMDEFLRVLAEFQRGGER